MRSGPLNEFKATLSERSPRSDGESEDQRFSGIQLKTKLSQRKLLVFFYIRRLGLYSCPSVCHRLMEEAALTLHEKLAGIT